MGVLVDLREVELRRVPAADAVVRAEVPGDGVAVGLGLVPLGEEEHVLAVLVREPRDGHRGVQGLVLSAHKTNFTNSMATSRHTVTGGMWFGRLLVIFSTGAKIISSTLLCDCEIFTNICLKLLCRMCSMRPLSPPSELLSQTYLAKYSFIICSWTARFLADTWK